MDIDQYVESIRNQFELAAEAGGKEAKAVAGRLFSPLESAVRLAVQDALAAAAEEITLELAPGSVELRLRGRDPEFVVSLPPADRAPEEAAGDEGAAPSEWGTRGWASREGAEGEDTAVARINLRLPDRLKSLVEQAAGGEGLSVNAWLVRAAATEVERRNRARGRERGTPHASQRYTGWAR